MKPKSKKRIKVSRKFNSFDRTVEMISEADSLLLSDFDKKMGVVVGEPYDSKTGRSWSMAMISSIEEAVASKYPKVWREDDKDLNEYFSKLKS